MEATRRREVISYLRDPKVKLERGVSVELAEALHRGRWLNGGQVTLLRRAMQTECRRVLDLRVMLVRAERDKPDESGARAKTIREIDEQIKASDELAEYLLKGDPS